MTGQRDVATVVVSYNTVALLERCLRSLEAQASVDQEIVVVDNASSDGSAAMVRERFPSVRLIANAENVGFGAACNRAIQATSSRYITLVNPDCEVEPGGLVGLVAFMDGRRQAAVAGGRLRYPDGSFQHSSFRFPSLTSTFLDLFPLHGRLLESRLNGRYPRSWDTRAFEIDCPLGAFICIRRKATEMVGLFDEAFFMYTEEVDWCYRFKRAGWEIWHCPDALAIHHSGRSTSQQPHAMFVQLHRSRMRYFRKHHPLWFRVTARAIVWAGMARRIAGSRLAEWRAGVERPEQRARVQACLEVMRL